jgi:chromosome segregation protein
MYLSKLEIFGFKSFALKTHLKFNDGIACLIGPNGSGKSNIVDSIRWVLGEQKTSTLRTDRMESVIFNGTNSRSPLGMAEVSLTIQNNKNIIQSPFSEVVVTRRLYRSGESHYLLNKMPCRLKDIQDLFMDTGMGADSYSVIELKMVESIISENPNERRHLFEEAAGVTKYKFRRKSALRKLETTQQDMSRISDLIAEINRTVNSLSRQVGKARHYLRYKDELKKAETDLGRFRFGHFNSEVNNLQQQLDEVHLIKEDTSQQITLEEALLEDYKREIIQSEENLRKLNDQLYQLDEKIHQLKEEEAVATTRTLSIHENTKRNHSDIAEYTQKIQNGQQLLQEARESLSKIQADFDQAAMSFKNLERQYQAAAEQLRQEKQILEQDNKTIRLQSEEMRAQKELLQEKSFQHKVDQDKVHAINLEDQHKIEREKEIDLRLNELNTAKTSQQQDHEKILAQISTAGEQLKSLTENITRQTERLHKQIAQIEFTATRIQFFEQIISRYEGHDQSTRLVMNQRTDFSGVHGPLADFLKVEDRYRPAFEAALGDMLNYLVVDDVQTAKTLLRHFEKGKQGRITCIPLSLVSKFKLSEDFIPGQFQVLSNLLQCPEIYLKIFKILLGDMVLVDDLDEGIALAEQHPELRVVTGSGEIIAHSHLISGGTKTSDEFSLLGRREQLAKVRQEKSQLETEQETIRAAIKELNDQQDQWHRDLAGLNSQLDVVLARLKDLERDELQLLYEKEFIRQNHTKRSFDLAGLQQEMQILQAEIEQLTASGQAQQDGLQVRENQYNQALAIFENKNNNLQLAAQQVQEARLQLETQKNQINNRQADIIRTEQTITELNEQILKRQSEIAEMQTQLQQLADRKLQLEQEKISIWQNRDQLEKDKDKISQQYHELKDKILNLETQIKRFRKQHDTSLERSRQLELSIQELQMKANALKDRLKEEYDEDISVGIAFDSLNVEETQQQIDHLKLKITQLGQVNPLAVSEYDKEKERLDFYNKQYNDLLEAEKTLRETIKKINITARNQFIETFNQIKQNFERVFKNFFENGEGALELQQDSDPLEANIEILVRPKGKRLQTIALLSGGEKTLTAISLLFAIYLVKPSPFCILDEIDAPLDDVNVNRFTNALREFSRDTQFIVVTHNKRTMEAASTLYGVTMEEEGLSKLVSVKFN